MTLKGQGSSLHMMLENEKKTNNNSENDMKYNYSPILSTTMNNVASLFSTTIVSEIRLQQCCGDNIVSGCQPH